MDSMRSLNTSLPRATGTQQPSTELLSSFKAAALSVTTLYKVAASDQARAKASGYQEALEDLLCYMEKDRLGFTDGEGSRIRQWAIERIDGSNTTRQESDEEDDEAVEDEKHRASSPDDLNRTQHADEQSTGDSQTTSKTPEQLPRPARDFTMPKDQSFDFRSTLAYPSNHDRETSNEGSEQNSSHNPRVSNNQPMRVEFLSLSGRHRPSRHSSSRLSNSRLGSGAGSKRRLPIGDFFDISGIGFDPKDFEKPSGKRARHT